MGEALPCKEEPLSCARENERGKLKTGERQYVQVGEREREREKTTEIASNGNRGCCKQAVGDT